jgi:hypothetical protein
MHRRLIEMQSNNRTPQVEAAAALPQGAQSITSGYSVRRPTAAEHFLGPSAVIVTTPNGTRQTVTWRSTAAGTVWSQAGGSVQETVYGIQRIAGQIDCIMAAMHFLFAEAVSAPLVESSAPDSAQSSTESSARSNAHHPAPHVFPGLIASMASPLFRPMPFSRPMPATIAPRVDFCQRFPHCRRAYLKAQREMVAAAKSAGLDTNEREALVEILCALLRINISSLQQLTMAEVRRATSLLAAGAIGPAEEFEGIEMEATMDVT